MKLKQSIRYQLEDYKASVLVYYCAVVALIVLMSVALGAVAGAGSNLEMSGISAMSALFLFICGLCSLHDNLPMLLQNGVSRKTMFLARLVVTGITAAFCAIVDHVLSMVINLLARPFFSGYTVSLFEQEYGSIYPSMDPVFPAVQLFAAPAGLLPGILYHCLFLQTLQAHAYCGGGMRRLFAYLRPARGENVGQRLFGRAAAGFLPTVCGAGGGRHYRQPPAHHGLLGLDGGGAVCGHLAAPAPDYGAPLRAGRNCLLRGRRRARGCPKPGCKRPKGEFDRFFVEIALFSSTFF